MVFKRYTSQKAPLPCCFWGPLQEGGGTYSALSSLPADPHPTPTEETVVWILPFTSGGFLYIALVNVLPDLLEEDDPW